MFRRPKPEPWDLSPDLTPEPDLWRDLLLFLPYWTRHGPPLISANGSVVDLAIRHGERNHLALTHADPIYFASPYGHALRFNNEGRSGDAVRAHHIPGQLGGAPAMTFGGVYRFFGTPNADEDSLAGKWVTENPDDTNQQCLLHYRSDNDDIRTFVETSSLVINTSPIFIRDGEFHLILGHYDGSQVRCWFDDDFAGSGTSQSGTVRQANGWYEAVGGHKTTGGSGAPDDSPRVDVIASFLWRRALEPEEMRLLHLDWFTMLRHRPVWIPTDEIVPPSEVADDLAWQIQAADDTVTAWRVTAADAVATAWRVFFARQTATAWGIAGSAAAAVAWRTLTRQTEDLGWQIKAAADTVAGWRVFVRESLASAWRITAQATTAAAWRIREEFATWVAWAIEAGALVSNVAWRVTAERSSTIGWRLRTRIERAMGWRVFNFRDSAVGWRVFNFLTTSTAWSILSGTVESIVLGWRIATRTTQPVAWRIAGGLSNVVGWRTLRQRVTNHAWRLRARRDDGLGWRILAGVDTDAGWMVKARSSVATAWSILSGTLSSVAVGWRTITRVEAPTGWRVRAESAVATGWEILGRVLASVPVGWRTFGRLDQPVGWRLTRQRQTLTAWRTLRQRATVTAWRLGVIAITPSRVAHATPRNRSVAARRR